MVGEGEDALILGGSGGGFLSSFKDGSFLFLGRGEIWPGRDINLIYFLGERVAPSGGRVSFLNGVAF